MNSNQLSVALVLAFCVVGGTALAEDGVSDGKIVFGQVAALQGPAQALGQGMRQGILAAFDAANRAGGISGRKLELKSLDDGYEPEKTVEATKRILDEDKVFALVGAVGTPTSKAGQPIATAEGAVHRPFHRRRILAQSVQPIRGQHSRLLLSGDRSVD